MADIKTYTSGEELKKNVSEGNLLSPDAYQEILH